MNYLLVGINDTRSPPAGSPPHSSPNSQVIGYLLLVILGEGKRQHTGSSFPDSQDARTHATTATWDGAGEICSDLGPLGVAGPVASLGVTAAV